MKTKIFDEQFAQNQKYPEKIYNFLLTEKKVSNIIIQLNNVRRKEWGKNG